MRYLMMICTDESADGATSPEEAAASMAEYGVFMEEMGKRGRAAGRRAPAPDDRCHDRSRPRRRDRHLRRSLRRDQGADRRLLRGRLQGPRRSHRDRGQDSRRAVRFDRSEADLGDVTPGRRRRRPGRRRGRVPRGVGPGRRDVDPRHGRLGRRRGMRAGRLRARPRTLATRRRPAQARRLAHHHRPQPCDRPRPPGHDRRVEASGGNRALVGRRTVPRRRQRRRRRPPAPDLHVLPPGALDRRAGRADAAHARRAHHRRDQPRVPGAGADDGAAPGAREAQDPQRRDPLPGSARASATGAHERGARRALPLVQRGLRGHGRGRPRAPEPVRGGDPARAHAGRAHARRARSDRACSRSCCCTTPRGRRGSTRPAISCCSTRRTAAFGIRRRSRRRS